VVGSNFAQGQGGVFGIFFKVARPFLLSTEKGARTSVYLAADPAIRGATGGYYKRERPARSSAASRDVAAQEALWAESERWAGLRPGGRPAWSARGAPPRDGPRRRATAPARRQALAALGTTSFDHRTLN
jgi:hypothetical protein